jgi:hypothetical protein
MLQADVSVGCAVEAVPRHTRQAYSPSDEPWSWDVDHLVCTHHNLCLYIASHVMFMNPTCTGKVGRSEGARTRRMADDGHEIFLDFWRERADETAPNRFFRAKPPLQSFTVMV